ncbi:Transcriptional regulator, LysR family, partial [Pseudomonas amygdali pv. tabaci]
MNRNELRKADINLMVVFETLMQERNVTRAAEKLFLGQPTISAALNRLRNLLNDPLFIRVGHRMEPTARAHEILKHLTPALDAMSTALSLTTDFDPSVSKMTFRIGLTDDVDVEFGLFPAMLKAIREEAPGVVIVVKHVDYLNISEVLMSGDITVGVCLTRELPANA